MNYLANGFRCLLSGILSRLNAPLRLIQEPVSDHTESVKEQGKERKKKSKAWNWNYGRSHHDDNDDCHIDRDCMRRFPFGRVRRICFNKPLTRCKPIHDHGAELKVKWLTNTHTRTIMRISSRLARGIQCKNNTRACTVNIIII